MSTRQRIEMPVRGMDCAHCCNTVQRSIAALPGIESVDVFLASEKAVVQFDPTQADPAVIRAAVEKAGYSVPVEESTGEAERPRPSTAATFTRAVLFFSGLIFGVVLLIVVAGEWLGLFEAVSERW